MRLKDLPTPCERKREPQPGTGGEDNNSDRCTRSYASQDEDGNDVDVEPKGDHKGDHGCRDQPCCQGNKKP